MIVSAGWPLPAFEGEVVWMIKPVLAPPPPPPVWSSAFKCPHALRPGPLPRPGAPRALPFRPVAAGLITNTVVLALPVWFLTTLAVALRPRRVALVAVLLVAGAVVNVAVAWGGAAWGSRRAAIEGGPRSWSRYELSQGDCLEPWGIGDGRGLDPWNGLLPADKPCLRGRGGTGEEWLQACNRRVHAVSQACARSTVPRARCVRHNCDARRVTAHGMADEVSLVLSRAGQSHLARRMGPRDSPLGACGTCGACLHGVRGCAAALRPVATAFAINTAFWALVLCTSGAAAGVLRRRWWRRRGVVRQRNMRLGMLGVCPECGQAVARKA
jgi:hypothetical protein